MSNQAIFIVVCSGLIIFFKVLHLWTFNVRLGSERIYTGNFFFGVTLIDSILIGIYLLSTIGQLSDYLGTNGEWLKSLIATTTIVWFFAYCRTTLFAYKPNWNVFSKITKWKIVKKLFSI